MANRLKSLHEIDLEELRKLASLHFSLRELAIMCQVPMDEFELAMDDESSDIYYAVNAGRLQAEAEVRNAAFTLARNGSTQGIKEAMEFIRRTRKDE